MRRLVVALSILTVLPVRSRPSAEELAASVPCFPLAATLLGGLLVALHLALGRALPAQVEAGLLLLTSWLLTGGIHLDGLADTADGLARGGPRAQMLEVMGDPRVGAAGAAAVALDLILKWSCLAALEPAHLPVLLALMPVTGRQAVVLAMWRYPSARAGQGLAGAFAGRITGRRAAGALLLTGTILLVISSAALLLLPASPARPAGYALAVAAGLAAGALAAALISHRLGGMTGDAYGAVCEISEAGFLLASLWAG